MREFYPDGGDERLRHRSLTRAALELFTIIYPGCGVALGALKYRVLAGRASKPAADVETREAENLGGFPHAPSRLYFTAHDNYVIYF
jgi:hypothetical protein